MQPKCKMLAFNKETLLIFALVAALFWVFYFYRENKKLKTDLASKKDVVASAPVPTPSPAPKPPRAKPAPPPPPKEEPEPEED